MRMKMAGIPFVVARDSLQPFRWILNIAGVVVDKLKFAIIRNIGAELFLRVWVHLADDFSWSFVCKTFVVAISDGGGDSVFDVRR